MTILTKFETTTDWQEITGVSDISGVFTLLNRGNNTILLSAGNEPTSDENAFTIFSLYERVVDNSSNTEKIWAKSVKDTSIININRG